MSSRAIASTSAIRGTLVSTHSSVVSTHAASSGSAAVLVAFDLDGTGEAAAAFNEQSGHS